MPRRPGLHDLGRHPPRRHRALVPYQVRVTAFIDAGGPDLAIAPYIKCKLLRESTNATHSQRLTPPAAARRVLARVIMRCFAK